MKNPFTTISDQQQAAVIDRWLAAKGIEEESSGWDLVESEDEWGIYTVGEVKELGRLAGLTIVFRGLDLKILLASSVVTDLFDDEWIGKIKTLDDVYMDLVLDFIEYCELRAEDCIQVTPGPAV